MKLMSLKQYMNMSKPSLIRKITKTLRAMPKVKLACLCYNITKSKLPRLRRTKKNPTYSYDFITKEWTSAGKPFKLRKQKALPRRKTKRKFSPKELAAQRLFTKRARAGTLRTRRRR